MSARKQSGEARQRRAAKRTAAKRNSGVEFRVFSTPNTKNMSGAYRGVAARRRAAAKRLKGK